ncbi:Myotubularin-related protein 6 [Portunus trituberculatus]|uniref:Myotubularin-related protein 6 n=1 Tax=Portunus trituberculatus TaxID=210409 RepID=A0A5B7F2B9_PORTR|nr:Myotubularin-related protein 6 [Portunus trituberculatus]
MPDVLLCGVKECCVWFQAALCRSSQPLSGFSARCEEDEQLLDCILRSNPNTSHMIVVDTRPKHPSPPVAAFQINAMANRAAGKGYENEAYYENIKFHFSGIENIHVMRASLAKQIEMDAAQQLSLALALLQSVAAGWACRCKAVFTLGRCRWCLCHVLELVVKLL